MKPAPYPADTRAKGWRFELDYEQIEQSDTWDLAGAEGRPWLLMMWLVSWRQVPCGSLPSDERVIAAKLGIPATEWGKHREVLLRGWREADDGRLYHQTLTVRVVEMMRRRRSDSDRKSAERLRKSAESLWCHADVTRDTGVTPTSVTPESSTDNRLPKTGDQTKQGFEVGIERDPPELPDLESHRPTPAGAACRAMRMAGISDTNPSHPDLIRLLDAGVTAQELADTARTAKAKGKGSFPYVLKALEGQRIDAAAKAAVPAHPVKPWDADNTTVQAKGVSLGLGPWDRGEWETGRGGIDWLTYLGKVTRAVERAEGQAA